MDLDERAVKLVEEAEELGKSDLRGALAKMREALAIEPDYPNLEDEIFIREDAIAKLDAVLEFIVVLLRESKEYQACEMLQGLPDNYIIQDKSGLVAGLVEKIEKAESLVNRGRDLAQKDPVKALSILEEAHKMVSDYPGLTENLATLKQDLSRYDSYVKGIEKALRNRKVDEATELFGKFREAYPEDDNVGRLKVAIVNMSKELVKRKDRKINFIKIGAAVGLVLALLGSYVFFEMFMIKNAERKRQEIDRLLAVGNFKESRALSREVRQDLGKVNLFFLGDKQKLQTKVEEVLGSEQVAKGAEGKVLFEGKYIPVEELAGTKAFRVNLEDGKRLVGEGNCLAAITKFEKALEIAANGKADVSRDVIAEIGRSIRGCKLEIVKGFAEKALALKSAGAYDPALAEVMKALSKSEEYDIDDKENIVAEAFALKVEINLAKLEELIKVGDKHFAEKDFERAIKVYRQAAAFADADELGGPLLSDRLRKLINKSKVESLLVDGDSNLSVAKWHGAALSYEKGIALANEVGLRGLASLRDARKNLAFAQRMEKVVELGSRNERAEKLLKSGKVKKARGVYKLAIEMGEDSKWRQSDEMGAVLDKLRKGLAAAEEKIFIEEKRQFLLERYSAILKKDFGLDKSATLLDPEVALMNSTSEILEFSLSAMAYAKKGGQQTYTRYQAIYIFDRKSKNWRLADKIRSGR